MRHIRLVASALLTGLIALQISFAAGAAPTLEEMAKRPLKTIERQAKAGDTASQVELARRYGSGDGLRKVGDTNLSGEGLGDGEGGGFAGVGAGRIVLGVASRGVHSPEVISGSTTK